jgi:signal transduction histidine kinase
LERSFYNLLTNAGRAMPEGGTLTLRTRWAGDGQIAVDIQDTGVGVGPEVRDRLFRIGFSDWRDGTKGSGLGLYVARRNVENHGGEIEVISRPEDGGSLFTVRLPVHPEGAPGAPSDANA